MHSKRPNICHLFPHEYIK
ncbi:hypothetical protein Q5M85_21095 [Paraclostridium bifermentans]|nr:hypothetical protein [Paraclostridium bifermentans]